MIGLATAGLVPWDVALVAAGTTLAASIVGAYAVTALVPDSEGWLEITDSAPAAPRRFYRLRVIRAEE